MESILLFGVCSAVDALGNMLFRCTCFPKDSTESSRGRELVGEIDNASVVQVRNYSSPSSDTSQIRRNVHFSHKSAVSIIHKSPSCNSPTTTSTCSTFSIYGNSAASDLKISDSLPIPTLRSSSSREFVEVELATSSNNPALSLQGSRSPLPQQQLQLDHQQQDRHAQRYQFLGHTRRKRKVRKLLVEDIVHRQGRLETIPDG